MKKKLLTVLLLMMTVPLHGLCGEAAPGQTPPEADNTIVGDDFPLFDQADIIEVWDPLEPVNRGIFWFNDKTYFLVIKPLARGWRHAPEPLRISLRNFFENLQAPIRIVNAGLQGKFAGAGTEITRFLTNSTLGIGGLFDPSKEHFNQLPVNEDTGQTLGYYGIGSGPYLVLPFIGPSSLRDGIGNYADTYLNLAWYIWGDDKSDDNYDYVGSRVAETINFLSIDKDTYEGVKRDALDPYLFMRDAFAQYRRDQIRK